MSRKLTDLSPATYRMWIEFDRGMRAAGIEYIMTCTYRSEAEQAELFARGRTKPGRIITNAPPGMSAHNAELNGAPASEAFDVVPLRFGKAVWGTSGDGIDDNPADDDTDDLELWQRVGVIGEKVGLQWAGRWKTFKEFPHFQNPEV